MTTLVAHEPPLLTVLPDVAAAERARAAVRDAYHASESNAGTAAFIAMASWRGALTEAYFTQPAPDPAAFGMPTTDHGSRDDPLLSDRPWAVSSYRLDLDALLYQPATVFPSHHGGFLGDESSYPGQPRSVGPIPLD